MANLVFTHFSASVKAAGVNHNDCIIALEK